MNDTLSRPAEGSGDTLSVYRPTVTWLVGLSGAAVGGAFLNFDKVSAAPWCVRLVFFLAAAAFGVAVYYGVHYIFYMNEVSNQNEHITFIEKALESCPEEKKQNLRGEKAEADQASKEAWKNLGDAHNYSIWGFGFGMFFSAVLLGIALAAGVRPKPQEAGAQNFISVPRESNCPTASVFEITQSAVHATSHGREAHTFLLNKNTGELWRMVCRKPDEVDFRRVHRIGFNNQSEDPVP
jgi:hypothetical protein